MAVNTLIQIVKNVVDRHVKRLLLIILKPPLRVASSSEQALPSLMTRMARCLKHTSYRGIVNKHVFHIAIVGDALKLRPGKFRICCTSSTLKVFYLLEHSTAACFHNLLWSRLRVVLSQLLLRV